MIDSSESNTKQIVNKFEAPYLVQKLLKLFEILVFYLSF